MGKYLILAIGIGAFALFGYIVWILRLNSKSVHEAKEAANIDVLTGLQNRTSYENYCSRLKNDKIVNKIKCIYIDVNGLHEINNNKGHLAGDMMLKLVAEVLKETFEGAKIYRIGGDEFVIFSDDKLERVRDRIKSAYDTILKNEYHISYGLSYGEVLEDIIKDSEVKMYDMKKAYYKSIGKEVRNKLETK